MLIIPAPLVRDLRRIGLVRFPFLLSNGHLFGLSRIWILPGLAVLENGGRGLEEEQY